MRSLRLYVVVSLIVWLAFGVYAMKDPADAYGATEWGPVGTVLAFLAPVLDDPGCCLAGLPTVKDFALIESLASGAGTVQWAWRLVVAGGRLWW